MGVTDIHTYKLQSLLYRFSLGELKTLSESFTVKFNTYQCPTIIILELRQYKARPYSQFQLYPRGRFVTESEI